MGLREWFTGSSAPEIKDSRVGRMLAFMGVGVAVWTARNYPKFAVEGYQKNAVMFSAVLRRAEAVAAITPCVYVDGKEVKDHPLKLLLEKPNPEQTRSTFIRSLMVPWLLGGSAYVERVGLTRVRELYTLRPDRIQIISGARGFPQAFRYMVGGRLFDFQVGSGGPLDCDLLQLKTFHPLDDYAGLGVTDPAAFAIDVHNQSSQWIKALLDNAARPSGAFVYENKDNPNLTDQQYERMKTEAAQTYSGASNAGKPMILDGGMSWVPMGSTPLEMDFLNTRNQMAREICLAVKTPPMILGIPGDNTYSNYQEANAAFHRDTVIPDATEIYARLSQWIGPRFGMGIEVKPDLDEIPALAAERQAVWDKVEAASFLTMGEKRVAIGYSPTPDDGQRIVGDVPVPVSPTVVPDTRA